MNQKLCDLVHNIHEDIEDMCMSNKRWELNASCLCALEKLLKLHTVMDRMILAKDAGIMFEDVHISDSIDMSVLENLLRKGFTHDITQQDIDDRIKNYEKTLDVVKDMDLGEI